MGGHAPSPRHGHWHEDAAVRLLLIALAVVMAVFLIALTLMTEAAGGLV
jgi:hypothetical protein